MTADARFPLACLAFAALAWLAGCAGLSGLVNPAGRLLEQGRTAIEQKDLDGAYAHLKAIRERYSDSPESREAFPLAAGIFKWSYHQARHSRPDSRWVRSEPGFMLDWFASFLDEPEFPQPEAEALFLGMPYGFFRQYLGVAGSRPQASRWALQAEDDNGIIERIAAEARAH